MASGLYPADIVFERFLGSVSATSLSQKIVVPADLDIIGLVASVGTAPGATNGVVINISNSPTSQLAKVSAYNLWTSANAPSILGTNTTSYSFITGTVVENLPYAVNYPLPGPSGTTGYVTAQSTSQTTETPVTSPPTLSILTISGIVAPDNTYTDYNGLVAPASWVRAGDILTINITAGGSSVSLGSAANLEISLLAAKR